MLGCSSYALIRSSEPVNQHEQQQPDYVHEVPVPGDAFEREMMFGGEMAGHGSTKNHDQHDRPNRHVKSVEPSQHEEGCTIGSHAKREIVFVVSMHIFVSLQAQEQYAQCDSCDQADYQL